MFRPAIVSKVAAIFAALFTLGACTPRRISSYAAPTSDRSAAQTFAWGPSNDLSTGDQQLDGNQFFDERIRARVDAELRRRGFEKETNGRTPGLFVHYHASVTHQVDLIEVDRTSSGRPGDPGGPMIFDAGTILVDFVDPRTNTVVWRGSAEGSLQGAIDDQELMEMSIDDAIARILRRLPRTIR
jgi:hypothetical protein